MRIDRPEIDRDGDAFVVSAAVRPQAGKPFRLWFRLEGLAGPPDPAGAGDAFVIALLPACMVAGEPLETDAALSPRLLESLPAAQQVLATWYRDLGRVDVVAPAAGATPAPAPGTGCCFTGGVDSWFTLLRCGGQVSHLLLARGFDVPLDDAAQWAEVVERVRGIGGARGHRVVAIATNLREVADCGRLQSGFAGDFWGGVLHGPALAALGQLCRHEIGRLVIPSTHAWRELKPWGSSPLLDPLWSTEGLEISHDGCDASRAQKVARLADEPLALATLRVCYQPGVGGNCCRCEKCIRTMLALRLAGVLDRATGFPLPLDLRAVRRLAVPSTLLNAYRDMLARAERGPDRELTDALRVVTGGSFGADRAIAVAWRGLAAGVRLRRREAVR